MHCMSPNVVSFNNSDYLFFNSAILEIESIFCRNNEDILYVKMVILYSKNIELVSLSVFFLFDSHLSTYNLHLIWLRHSKAQEDILRSFMWLSFLGIAFPCHPHVWHICLTVEQATGMTFRDNKIVIFKIWKIKQIREWRSKHWDIFKEPYQP